MDILQRLYKSRNNMCKHHMPTEASLFGEAADTIESLRAELEEERKNSAAWERYAKQREKDLKAVMQQHDQLVVDAMRYRWLRTQPIGDIEDVWHSVPERFDGYIDDALAKLGADKTAVLEKCRHQWVIDAEHPRHESGTA